jgi:hypothetical protein
MKHSYSSIEEALLEMALSAIRKKKTYYRRRIRNLEKKYGTNFNDFSIQLKNHATPAEEDDWFMWKSALSMLSDWQKTYQELTHEFTC